MEVLDLHHIPNAKDGKRLLDGFEINNSIAIAIPSFEHKNIQYQNYACIENPRILLAREIKNLRKHTTIPSKVLIKIINANKNKYPELLKI